MIWDVSVTLANHLCMKRSLSVKFVTEVTLQINMEKKSMTPETESLLSIKAYLR